jgi:hypothetical protein
MNASMEKRVEKLERATAAPTFVFIPHGETPESVFKAHGIPAAQADSVSYLRWLPPESPNAHEE